MNEPEAQITKPRRIRKPWLRALKRFIPLALMACAVTARTTTFTVICAVLAYGYLWMIEDDKDSR